jgi:hypothetical protein
VGPLVGAEQRSNQLWTHAVAGQMAGVPALNQRLPGVPALDLRLAPLDHAVSVLKERDATLQDLEDALVPTMAIPEITLENVPTMGAPGVGPSTLRFQWLRAPKVADAKHVDDFGKP